MEERPQFICDAQSDRFTMAELCARYGVSRRIGYKWLAHFAEEDKNGLRDRSRKAHFHPATSLGIALSRLNSATRRLRRALSPSSALSRFTSGTPIPLSFAFSGRTSCP